MHDAGAVDGVESHQGLHRQRGGVAGRQRAAFVDELVQVDPLDVLRDHVMRAVFERGEVEERGHVGVMDARGHAGLAEEALVRALVVGDAGAHQLDHAQGVEVDVQRLVDLAHAADAEARQDLVLPVERRVGVAPHEIGDRFTAVGAGFVLRIDLRPAVDAMKGHSFLRLYRRAGEHFQRAPTDRQAFGVSDDPHAGRSP